MNNSNVIRAFSEEHAARLTGLSRGQLRAWDKAGFFVPRYSTEVRGQPYSRIYSFEDIVGLRAVAILKKEHKISLAELKRAAHELKANGYDNWANLQLNVINRQVHFTRPGTDEIEGVRDGQKAMVPMIRVITDVQDRVNELQTRSEKQFGKVERHKYVMRNEPVISGTRIPTAAIKRFAEAGYTVQEIMRQYPTLTEEDVRGALKHENFEKKLARTA